MWIYEEQLSKQWEPEAQDTAVERAQQGYSVQQGVRIVGDELRDLQEGEKEAGLDPTGPFHHGDPLQSLEQRTDMI